MSNINALFLDIGGVLLTNGWDRNARKQAIELFGLEALETEERHHLTFDTYEEGKLTLDEYLTRVVFYKERTFTRQQFKEFMLAQSAPYPEMIDLIVRLKEKYKLKIAIVNNEGRELNEHRIHHFNLNRFVDFYISSCFVHFRKPDADIYKIALDIAQVKPAEVIYLEDRSMFVDVAKGLGINAICHQSYQSTVEQLAAHGLVL
ncbi:putative hydrolase of the HAD superfamily [Chitinophaga terrae (ex Kim and Jung 2007)]|uniref:Putative hydrolase of the HAD superfamily n=1 Tax=Chitinophaga terrae (ex Kim and Jung 2007) TaxID=408074 RepID=A0A1H4AP81_9BACT|nr:HAD family phosphatase [Chitinophaga terrae (ex Kim and Jung 2007)]MDQ0106683.1 putative hydrolase of the HAD superfamily [Chitinophaga terrae (ex Kim and Jung 2007)]GEP89218.1 hydrolase [Chitinophaga terrae (ex Kim and Jung 2007)]SEA37750.1 putative hydrolase of the HAD superfamily [Chitinophaga terrae (ex Kim and Jung 2007)]